MVVNNNAYGGFVVSKNVVSGRPIKYSFRDKSDVKQLNGWNIYSVDDDDTYVNNSSNFVILNAESVYKINQLLIEIFVAPDGTDLCWMYKEGVHIGFYDLKNDKEVTIKEILK
jgi:hypothetical protein